MRLAGPCEAKESEDDNMVAAIIDEGKPSRKTNPVPLTGSEMARMMKIGTRVVRGPDWKWGDQVGVSFTQFKSSGRFKGHCLTGKVSIYNFELMRKR